MTYHAKIISLRTGAIGYLDHHGVPHGTAADAGAPFATDTDARAAFDLYAENLIRVTGVCRWALEVVCAGGGGS